MVTFKPESINPQWGLVGVFCWLGWGCYVGVWFGFFGCNSLGKFVQWMLLTAPALFAVVWALTKCAFAVLGKMR